MACEPFRDEMLDVLYDEADPATRRRVEGHLAECAACREELKGLRGLRHDLAAWRLPEPRTRPTPAIRTPPWWRVAAAAVLLLACGGALGLAGFELEYNQGPVRISLGRADTAELRLALAAQEARHQAALAELQSAVAARPSAVSSSAPVDEERLLQRVAQLVERSEARQAAQLEASWDEFVSAAEDRRRYDLARISAGLSYLDQKAGAQAARTSELMGYVLQASDRR